MTFFQVFLTLLSTIFIRIFFFWPGKHAPHEVKVLPLDLTSGEGALKKAVQKAESFFPDTGVDYMIHNAAFERPVSENNQFVIVRS